MPFSPGIITSSRTTSGGSPCLTAASISSPREYDAGLVSSQREERPKIIGEGGIVVNDGDVGFFQRFNSPGAERLMRCFARRARPDKAGDQMRPPCASMTRRAIGQREPDASAFFVEWSRRRIVCCLYARFFGDDDNG